MTCDSLMLRRLVTELQELCGLRVERVFPTARLEFALELRTRQPGGQIVISGNPDSPRLHRTDDAEPLVGGDTPLADVLRRHLRGATLTAVEQLAFDRVVTLRFANCEGLGPQSRRALVAEISGRHTNLLLLDEDGVILECARHVTARVNRVRQSLPGEPWSPPPDFGKLDPEAVTGAALAATLPTGDTPWPAWLRTALQGGSDTLLAVLAARLDWPLDLPAQGLTQTACDQLAAALHALLAAAAAPGAGYLATPPKARPVAYPVPLPPTWDDLGTLDSLSAACSVLHRRLQDAQVSGQLRQRLTSCLQAARTRAQRCEDARAATLAEAADAEIWRHRGDLLLANLHVLTPQATEVTVDDWETGQPVTLALDPALSPTANAQRYFGRYKKLQRVLDQVPALLAEARAEREDYEDLLDQVAEAGVEELRVLEEELRQRDLLPAAKRARQPVKVDYRRAQTSDGYAVLYGRSSLENAAVLKAASPDDLWFHVQGTPGGHVVLRTNNRPGEVPQTALLEAARLAARQSLRRREAVVAVDYTLIKRLTHIRGAGPGHVVYRDCQTLMVKPRD